MKLIDAQNIIQKLKTLENVATYKKNGVPIHRFLMIPSDLFKYNEFDNGLHELWYSQDKILSQTASKLDYKIIGVHRNGLSTYLWSDNLEYFISQLNQS